MRVAVACLLGAVIACAQEWPDTFVGRLEVLALEQTINAEVLASRSATLTLEAWCRDHALAKEPKIVAELVKGAEKAPTAEQRQRLRVSADETVKYRHVRLRCGDRVLSEADNWYVPARVSAEMNRLLETTDTPFGKAVAGLEPYRQTFAMKVLWSPLPEGWERGRATAGSAGALGIPDALFEHQAVLYTREHLPFSEVDEIYRRDLLAFAAPKAG